MEDRLPRPPDSASVGDADSKGLACGDRSLVVIRYSVITFPHTDPEIHLAANLNQYTFEVNPRANRKEVARAVEKVFNVSVTKVNILNRKPKAKTDRSRGGRPGTKGGLKKAIVSLKEGDKIELV